MKIVIALAAIMALSACATQEAPPRAAVEQRGLQIAQTNCGSCHAVGRSGDSTAPEAPPFRRLSENYRVSNLEEALAEGISVGHPAMPQFEFSPEDVDALVAYLQSIQDTPAQ
jgi:cytochrome c